MPGSHRVGGVPTAGGSDWFTAIDPRTGRRAGDRFPEATAEDITAAVDEAVRAWPQVGALPSAARGELLRRLADQLDRQGTRLVALADVETGLGREHLSEELADCAERLRQLGRDVARGEDVSVTITTAGSRTMRTGRGPVVVFGAAASPFVFGVAGTDAMTALAAGCPVVHKASAVHPATAEALGALVDAALAASGWPAGAHGLLHGRRRQLDEELVAVDGVVGVAFTGAFEDGRALFDLAVGRSDPVAFHGNFDSINPAVVMGGAIRARRGAVADVIARATTRAGGQSPVRPGLVFVPDDVDGEWFIDAVADGLRAAGAQPMLTADIHTAFATTVGRRSAITGVTPIVERIIDAGQGYAQDAVLLAVSLDDFLASPVLAQECLGPLLLAVRCDPARFAEAVGFLDGALVGGLYTDVEQDGVETVQPLVEVLAGRVGRLVVNEPMGLPPIGARAMYGGPWPAASDVAWTSLGPDAVRRWQRPVTYQDCPDALLPAPLQDANPWGIDRIIDGALSDGPVPG